MTRARKLKVYRTPIGFHDAYVAAPSQKAALAAWGSDADLFARGMAEAVTDEDLMREPLDKPGTVIRRARGTSAEHMAALPKDRPAPKAPPAPDDGPGTAPTRPRKPAKAPPPPKPKPGRDALDAAEKAVDDARVEHDRAIAALRERETELQRERRALEARYEREAAALEKAADAAREDHRAALKRWRG